MDELVVESLQIAYGKKKIIQNLSITGIKRGEITALLGPNGSGKSTLLKGIAGIVSIQGRVVLFREDLTRLPFNQKAKQVVYLPQSLPDNVHLRVLESLLVAKNASSNQSSDHDTINEANQLLKRLGIEQLGMCFLDELSGGQKQLVGLAQALIRKPTLLLLDEPLSALDLNFQHHVMDIIRQETVARNMVTLIVLHDINIALQQTDRVLMLKKGHLLTQGIPTEVITADSLADVYGVQGTVEYSSNRTPYVLIEKVCGHFN